MEKLKRGLSRTTMEIKEQEAVDMNTFSKHDGFH